MCYGLGSGADATGYVNGYTEKTAYGDFVSDYLRLACARGREQGGDLSRSLCMKTSEQKSLSPRTKPAPHYCKPPPQENWKGATGKSFRSYREIR